MNNFVFAVDENYNHQLFYSIYSLLDNIDSKINLYIIHKNPMTFSNFHNRLQKEFDNFNLYIYKFEYSNFYFPEVENRHVSEATYYRLFIDKIIPEEVDQYIYMDADIICVNNPEHYINEVFEDMSKKKYIIASRTENNLNSYTEKIFKRLDMKSSKYFNAGVMFVDHQKWLKNNIGESLLKQLEKIKDKIIYWDQDVLNSFFDGDYIEISQNINYPINLRWPMDTKEIKRNALFIHYQSNNKPWSIRSVFNKGSSFYQDVAIKTLDQYHLVKTVRRFDLLYLIINTLTFKFLNLKRPLNFYKISLLRIFSYRLNI